MLAGRGAKDLTEFACQEDQLHPPWLEAVGSTSPRDFVSVAVAAGEASAHPFANHGQGSRVAQSVEEEDLEWSWAQIADELRERRRDMNYDNISKGLKDMPNASLACPSTQVTKVDKPPKPPKAPKTAKESDASALPADAKGGTGKGKKSPCAMHASGLCRFGSRCRNEHVGDTGSDAAKKAYMKAQEGQGDKGSKRKGWQGQEQG